MRCCRASAARILTLFSLALLSSQSLLLANAQTTSSSIFDILIPGAQDASTPAPAAPTGTPESASTPPSTSSSIEVTSTPATTSKTPSTTSSTRSPSTSSSVQSTSSTEAPPPTSTSDTASSTASSSVSSSATSTSISSSSSSSSLSTSLTSSIPTISSTSTGVTLISQTATAFVATATTNALATDDSATSYTWSTSESSAATGAAANGSSASSTSFFDNKGAVAGLFSVLALVAIGAVIMVVVLAKRRAARLQDEEDMAYFEKYNGSNGHNASTVNFNNGADASVEPETGYASHGSAHGMDVNDEPLATHAAADAYPDRTTHFGLPTLDEYSQAQGMGLNFQTVVDYPPGMSYGPAQYAGYEGGYGAAAQNQQPYYQPSYAPPTSPSHPYAHPSNSARMARAPPVQFFGEAN